MMHKQQKSQKFFSIKQANAMLPLVRVIVADLASLSRDVVDRRRRLSFLLSGYDPDDRDLYHQELVQVKEELDKDAERLQEYVEELRALEVQPTNGPEGIVTFPSLLDGRRVCLSWKLGDPEVLYWHEQDVGYRRRRPLPTESLAP